jgi:hypothetical protein
MVNGRQFLYIWRLELLEKVTYFEDFLAEANAELHHRNIGIIASLHKVLERLKQDLSSAHDQLKVSAGVKWSDRDAIRIYARLSNISDRFIPVHQALYWVFTPWAEDETYSMLRSLFDTHEFKELYERLNPTIAFISEFNFLHIELHHYWRAIQGLTEEGSLLALPKIAKRDCLSWPLLAHELGHAVYDLRSLETDIIQAFVPEGERTLLNPRILNWAKELTCDLLAIRMFGPAYFFAFVASVLFFDSAPMRMAAETHPAPWDRAEFMLKYLTNSTAEKSLDPQERKRFAEINFWKQLLDTKVELQRMADGFMSIFETIEADRRAFERVSTVIDRIAYKLNSLVPSFDVQDFTSCRGLVEALEDGLIIASSRASQEDIGSLLDQSQVDFDKVCAGFDETPNKPVVIVNAGWLAKIKAYTRAEDAKADNLFADSFRERNWYIQKSIETSLIHNLLNEEAAL